MTEPTDTPSLYDRMGGANAIEQLVESFYQHMDTLPQAQAIRVLHPADLGRTKQDLKRYLAEWTGGPALYTPEKGHPRMRARHMHVPIGADARDAWLLCMACALEDCIKDEQARAALFAPLAKLADWMRNQPD